MIKNGLIFILILMSVFLFSVKTQKKTITKSTIDTVISYKTLTKYTKGDNIPYKILDTIYKTNYDTAYIFKDYNQAKEYIDSIRQDSNIYVIRDTISQNKVIGRSFQAKIQEKEITITNNIEIAPKASLYLGIRSDLSNDMLRFKYNINMTLKTRKKGLFSVGYGMSGYSIGYSIKL
jgi:hypothetical protein